MGKKMKKHKTTAADLPDEILRREILTRLPIKSAVRFKSVSKSWLSLFSNPQFVKQHHTYNSTQNPNDYDCLVADKGTRLVILSRYKETKLLAIDNSFFLIGSINGLVCIRRGVKFSLWNPAIHQSKEFTLPPQCGVNGYNIGLGFDNVSYDYKVVVLSDDLMYAIVYCSGLDCWSYVSIPDHVFQKIWFEESRPIAIVKGCPYWTLARYTYDQSTYQDEKLGILIAATLCAVKFNAETYEFSVTPEFHFEDGKEYGGGYEFCHQFVDMKDCLTLITHNRNSVNCMVDIYTLDGEEEGCGVWSKMYTLEVQFYTRGWYVSLSQGFKYDGEILYHENGIFSCIDPETDEVKRLLGTTSTDYDICCFRYEPTLFFIQGMKSVHLTTQTRTHGGYRTPRQLLSSLRHVSFS